jgi:hypothetical protein
VAKHAIQAAVKFTMNPTKCNEIIQNLPLYMPLYTAATIKNALPAQEPFDQKLLVKKSCPVRKVSMLT